MDYLCPFLIIYMYIFKSNVNLHILGTHTLDFVFHNILSYCMFFTLLMYLFVFKVITWTLCLLMFCQLFLFVLQIICFYLLLCSLLFAQWYHLFLSTFVSLFLCTHSRMFSLCFRPRKQLISVTTYLKLRITSVVY